MKNIIHSELVKKYNKLVKLYKFYIKIRKNLSKTLSESIDNSRKYKESNNNILYKKFENLIFYQSNMFSLYTNTITNISIELKITKRKIKLANAGKLIIECNDNK